MQPDGAQEFHSISRYQLILLPLTFKFFFYVLSGESTYAFFLLQPLWSNSCFFNTDFYGPCATKKPHIIKPYFTLFSAAALLMLEVGLNSISEDQA